MWHLFSRKRKKRHRKPHTYLFHFIFKRSIGTAKLINYYKHINGIKVMNNNIYGFFRRKFCQVNISIFSDRAADLANKGEAIDAIYLDIRHDLDPFIQFFPNQTREVYLKSYIL